MTMTDLKILFELIRLVSMTIRKVHGRVKIKDELRDSFDSNTGLRQGDSYFCLLCNTALDKVIRDSSLQKTRTILTKSIQGYWHSQMTSRSLLDLLAR